MAVRIIDAIDSMGNGGYIDLCNDRYIPPKWFSDLCEANNTGFTAEDYESFERDSARYLKPPIIHAIAIWGLAALQMGVSREQLRQYGMIKEEYWEIYLPRQSGDNERYCYQSTDTEEAVINEIEKNLFSSDKYNLFMCKTSEILCEIVIEWMREHGVSLIE